MNKELEKFNTEENSIYAILSKLEHFIREAARSSSSSLSDVWDIWNTSHKKNALQCWKINGCAHSKCKAYQQENFKCWLLESTICSIECDTFAQKVGKCFDCSVIEELRQNTPEYLGELISILIKFLMMRDKELVNIAIHDALTGVYNRFYFDEYISHEVFTAERHGEAMSFIMVDIDKFKQVNDTYGHAAGDAVLIAVVNILQKAVRSEDIIFRLGGDEFLLVFPRANCPGVERIRERIAELLAEWNVSNVQYGKYELKLSLGCSTWRPGNSIQDKIREADADMYAVKTA